MLNMSYPYSFHHYLVNFLSERIALLNTHKLLATSPKTDILYQEKVMPEKETALKQNMESIANQALQETGLKRMKFSPALEDQFAQYNSKKMRENLHDHGLSLIIIYLAIAGSLFLFIPIEQLGHYPWIIVLLFFGLMLRTIDSHIAAFDPYTEIFSAIGGGLSISAMLYGLTTVSDSLVFNISLIGIVLFIISHYTFLNLRTKSAVLGSLIAIPIFIVIASIKEYSIDWLLFSAYFLAPCVIGAGIAYTNEYRARTVFLQELLLKQEKQTIEKLYQEVHALSRTDYLSNLHNRRHLMDMLEHEWARGSRSEETLAIIFADIDYFKQYNDCYGHEAGDKAITQVASALRACATRGGDIVARYGGEEFVLVLPNTQQEQVLSVLSRIQQAIKNLHIIHQASQVSSQLSLSLGVYICTPSQEENYQSALNKADQALYKAKQAGRNSWCFYTEEPN